MRLCRAFVILGILSFASVCDEINDSYQRAKQLQDDKEYAQALSLYEDIIERDPTYASAYVAGAQLCYDLKDYEKSRTSLMRLFDQHISFGTEVGFNFANLLLRVGELSKARTIFENIYKTFPSPSVTYNIAYISKALGEVDRAIAILEQLVARNSNNEEAQFSLGHSLLAKGDFVHGWRQHDRFLRRKRRYTPILREWIEHHELAEKRILLNIEGGLGDTIQFFRCAQWLKDEGAIVYAVVQKPLVALFSTCPYIDQLLTNGNPLPAFDATSTFMTIPALFDADEEKMSVGIPYIFPDPEREEYWHQQLREDKQFKIGICWQADLHNDESRLLVAHRGIPLELLLRIAQVSGISIYSLQKKDGGVQLDELNHLLHEFGPDFDETHGSFVDTAAVMRQLDLVVTVDTAIAHLAGALGVPVWLLLPYLADWRWIIGRADSPWYPSMRIFKQPAPFDWESVVEDVITCLLQYVV